MSAVLSEQELREAKLGSALIMSQGIMAKPSTSLATRPFSYACCLVALALTEQAKRNIGAAGFAEFYADARRTWEADQRLVQSILEAINPTRPEDN